MVDESSNFSDNVMIDSKKGEYFDLFKSIFDNAENGICIVDYEGKFVELNNIYADMFGYNKHELIGKSYSSIISEDSQSLVQTNHLKIFNGTSIAKAEEKVQHKNGTFFYVQTTNLRVNDGNGNKLRITTAFDISNRLRNELVQSVLLKISNLTNLTISNDKLYDSIYKSVCQLLPIKNFAVCVNNKISNNLEYPFVLDEKQKNIEPYLEFEHNYFSKVKKTLKLEESSIKNLMKINVLGTYNIIPDSIIGIPLKAQNEILGSLIIKDYSENHYSKEDIEFLELVAGQVSRAIERKNYEEELVNARKQAEDAVRIKSEFLAQISHEIRTPLNSILSFSQLIKNEINGTLTPELEESFGFIERGGTRLTRTIDLILNASKPQNNHHKILLEDIDLSKEILAPMISEFQENSKTGNVKLQFEDSNESFRLVCDQYSMNQLFINLIDNALKYTTEGFVKIKIFQNEYGKIQVDIRDTGIGISAEYIPKLFEPFSQEEQGYTRSYEGIGLGLSLVKNYAELNNAEIKVSSEKNIGSIFSVIFN